MTGKQQLWDSITRHIAELEFDYKNPQIAERRRTNTLVFPEGCRRLAFMMEASFRYQESDILGEILEGEALVEALEWLRCEYRIIHDGRDMLKDIILNAWRVRRDVAISEILEQLEEWEIAPSDVYPFLDQHTLCVSK